MHMFTLECQINGGLINFWSIILPSLMHFFVFDLLNLCFSDSPGVIWHPPVYLALESMSKLNIAVISLICTY